MAFNVDFDKACFECTIWFLVFNALITLTFNSTAIYLIITLGKQLRYTNIVVILIFVVVFLTRFVFEVYMFAECHD